MKRRIAAVVLIAMLTVTCMSMMCACNEKKPSEVEIEIINGATGKIIEQDSIVELSEVKTPIQVKIKDSKSGKYLSDGDLRDKTLEESISIKVYRLWERNYKEEIGTQGDLPIEQDGVVESNYYQIDVAFESRPDGTAEEDFKRKYESKTETVRFYSGRDWKGTDYFKLELEQSQSKSDDWICTPEKPEDYGQCIIPIWDIPELRAILNNAAELEELRNKKEYPFFNEKYAYMATYKAMQKLDEYGEEYFEDKSLVIIMQLKGDTNFYPLTKLSVEGDTVTVTLAKARSFNPYPTVLSVKISVIGVSKKALGNANQLKLEEILY